MLCKLLESKKWVAVLLFVAALPMISPIFGFIEGSINPVVGDFVTNNIRYHHDYIDIFTDAPAGELEKPVTQKKSFVSFSTENTAFRNCDLKSIRWYNENGIKQSFDVMFDDKAYWRVVGVTDLSESKAVFNHKCHIGHNTITVIKGFNGS